MATLPLAVPVSAVDTTITIIGTIQNCSGAGVITIGTEDISYTGNSSDQFLGCVRGANATTPAAHARYAEVTYTQSPIVTLPIAQVDVTPVLSPATDVVGTSGKLSLTNVSADIAATTVCVPSESGMYLYSFYGLATTAPSGADAAPNLYMAWTDEKGTQKSFLFAGNLDQTYSDGPNCIALPVYAVAGKPIWFYTSAGNYTGTVKWSFHFAVTKL
jgi:hypothetical protein